MTSASGTRAGGAEGAAGAGGAARRAAGVSQFAPFGVGLGGLPQQAHVAEQHDRRRHHHPPGGHPGERERAGPDGQHQQHVEQPPPRGQHLLVLTVPRPAAGTFRPGLGPGLRPDLRPGLGPGLHPDLGPSRSPRRHPLLVARRTRRGTGGILSPPRRGSGPRGDLGLGACLGFRVRVRRGEVLAVPLASRRIPPKPPGDEHASPDGDDGDVEYRAAQQSSPRRGRRRASSRDAK
jgi:hypothetical protein